LLLVSQHNSDDIAQAQLPIEKVWRKKGDIIRKQRFGFLVVLDNKYKAGDFIF